MPPNPENPKVRVRETTLSAPAGLSQTRHQLERVLEIDGPAPEGAEVVTTDPYDWRIAKENK